MESITHSAVIRCHRLSFEKNENGFFSQDLSDEARDNASIKDLKLMELNQPVRHNNSVAVTEGEL